MTLGIHSNKEENEIVNASGKKFQERGMPIFETDPARLIPQYGH